MTDDAQDGAELPRRWALTLVFHPEGQHTGKRVELDVGEQLAVGRGKLAFGEGALDGNQLSREHSLFAVNELDELRVEDLGSRNGTHVNAQKVSVHTLREGDVVSVGDLMILAGRIVAGSAGDPAGNQAYRQLLANAERLAASATPILFSGETGAGKDRLAVYIHEHSERPGKLVVVRCGTLTETSAIPELLGDKKRPGLLQVADGGTLYLDGIEDANSLVQNTLISFLDTAEVRRGGTGKAQAVDTRVIASASLDIPGLVAAPQLRRELIERLKRGLLRIPPLRHRREDILILAGALVVQFAGESRPLHRKLRLALLRHRWPGNVRELEALLEAAVIEQPDGPLMLTEELEERLREADPNLSRLSRVSMAGAALVAATSGTWCRYDGKVTDLSNRRTLSSIVAALIERRRAAPGQALSLDDLLAAGWPEERVVREAGRNRVHVALTTLRKLGLRDVILRNDDGYLIDPAISLQVEKD